MMRLVRWVSVVLLLAFARETAAAFEFNEVSEDDDEWGIVGGNSAAKVLPEGESIRGGGPGSVAVAAETLTRLADRKVQFTLEHSFGGSDFVPAGVFTALSRESGKSGQTLSNLRLTRNPFSNEEKHKFQQLIDTDGFYSVRVPSHVLSPGRCFALSSTKARCLAASNFQERFDIHMDEGHIIGITYGGSTSCSYPRASQTPSRWTFDSLIIVTSGEQASWKPLVPEIGEEDDGTTLQRLPEETFWSKYWIYIVPEGDGGTALQELPEKSFWSKYWTYIVPVGLLVANAFFQLALLPEEASGEGGGAAVQHRVAGPEEGGARR